VVIITINKMWNARVLPVAQSERRGHGHPRNKLAKILTGALYQFSTVRK